MLLSVVYWGQRLVCVIIDADYLPYWTAAAAAAAADVLILLVLAVLLQLEQQAEEKRSCSKSPGLEDELTSVVEEEPREYLLAVAGAEVQKHYNPEEWVQTHYSLEEWAQIHCSLAEWVQIHYSLEE